jgi:uncharacterized protein
MLTQPTTSLTPVSGSDRIAALDITRGIALLGILLMNIVGFGLGPWAYGNPAVAGGATGWNLKVFEINSLFFEGTMRGLFSLLFGVGVVLLTDRLIKKEAGIRVADIYFTRTIWLIVFGVVHAYLFLWWGEVLYAYGVMGLLLFVFRNTKPLYLILAALLLMSADVGRNYLKYDEMLENKSHYKTYQALPEGERESAPAPVVDGNKAWEESLKRPETVAEKYSEYVADTDKDYLGMVAAFATFNRIVQMELYEWGIYDILSVMLLGIAFYRKKIITAEKPYTFYLLLILVGYPVGIFINFYELNILTSGEFSSLAFAQSGITYSVGRLFVLMGHIGVIMIFCKSHILSFLRISLASVGRMALTNYMMHSVICMFLFYGFGFGLFGELQRYELYYVVAAIWGFQLIYSPIWLYYFRFGPLEWLWRSLTYRKWQSMRKIQSVPVPIPVVE